jgi:hypothetical protein
VAEVKKRVELYFYSVSGPSWPELGQTLPLPFMVNIPASFVEGAPSSPDCIRGYLTFLCRRNLGNVSSFGPRFY